MITTHDGKIDFSQAKMDLALSIFNSFKRNYPLCNDAIENIAKFNDWDESDLSSAIDFCLQHELAHIELGHLLSLPKNEEEERERIQQEESAADEYAWEHSSIKGGVFALGAEFLMNIQNPNDSHESPAVRFKRIVDVCYCNNLELIPIVKAFLCFWRELYDEHKVLNEIKGTSDGDIVIDVLNYIIEHTSEFCS